MFDKKCTGLLINCLESVEIIELHCQSVMCIKDGNQHVWMEGYYWSIHYLPLTVGSDRSKVFSVGHNKLDASVYLTYSWCAFLTIFRKMWINFLVLHIIL